MILRLFFFIFLPVFIFCPFFPRVWFLVHYLILFFLVIILVFVLRGLSDFSLNLTHSQNFIFASLIHLGTLNLAYIQPTTSINIKRIILIKSNNRIMSVVGVIISHGMRLVLVIMRFVVNIMTLGNFQILSSVSYS